MACCVQQKCSKKLIGLIRIISVSCALLCIGLCVATAIFIDTAAASLPLAASLFFIWLGVRYAPIYYRNLSYTRARSFFQIERGVFWHKHILIPNSKIQYADLRRSPSERITGPSTIVFFTPGGKITLPGLEPDDAKRLIKLLSQQ